MTPVDPADLVSVAEVADAAGVSRSLASRWLQRDERFPAPVAHLALGPIWLWPEVRAWLAATGRDERPDGSRVPRRPIMPLDRYAEELELMGTLVDSGHSIDTAAAGIAESHAHRHRLTIHSLRVRLRATYPTWARMRSDRE